MKKVLLITTGLLFHTSLTHAQRDAHWTMHDWMMRYSFGGFIMWLLFLILIGVVVYLLMQSGKNKGITRVEETAVFAALGGGPNVLGFRGLC
jgi:hypothetical protein